jgi:hypothetical protein
MTKLLSCSFVAVVLRIDSLMSLCFDLLLVWTAAGGPNQAVARKKKDKKTDKRQ